MHEYSKLYDWGTTASEVAHILYFIILVEIPQLINFVQSRCKNNLPSL